MRRLTVDQIRARRDTRIVRAARQQARAYDRGDDVEVVNWVAVARWDRALLRRLAVENETRRVAA